MEQTEYPAMSGSNTICVVTVLLETGMIPIQEPVTKLVLEAPAGLIEVRAQCANGKVTAVTFRNVGTLWDRPRGGKRGRDRQSRRDDPKRHRRAATGGAPYPP